MNDSAQQIKSKIDIADFLRGYIELRPAGKNFKAVCPFHKEKTPSFMVSPDRQTWHCFGSCNTGGDIFTFLMRYENLEFFEALKFLAEKAGVELKRLDPAEQRQFGVLYDIQSVAANFFVDELKRFPRGLTYLKERGLKPETINEFEIGFAPNKQDALTLHLIHKGFSVQDIERSGTAFKGDRGGYVDRFRGRIMFPILNHFGKPVGFTGRILPEFDNGTAGKYVNSPETAIFKKSKILYGFYKTKHAIREANEVFLVEGQMDFLMSYQDSVTNVVATSGTALTGDHLVILRKRAERAVLCFDSDEAGLHAAERAIDLSLEHDFDVRVLLLPEGAKDPAEVVEKTPGKLKELLPSASTALEFYYAWYFKSGINKKTIRAILAKIKKMPSAIDRTMAMKSLGEKTGIGELALNEELEQIKVEDSPTVPKAKEPELPNHIFKGTPSRRDMLTENLMSLAIAKQDVSGLEPHLQYFSPTYLGVYEFLKNSPSVSDPRVAELANILSLRAGNDLVHDEVQLVHQLKKEFLKTKEKDLLQKIKLAENRGGESELSALMKEFDLLSKEIHN